MAWYDGIVEGATKFGSGLAGMATDASKWAFGNDGIGGQSGAIGGIGDWITGTDAVYGKNGLTTPSVFSQTKAATPGLFGGLGSWIENNPETAKLGVSALGGLASYGLQRDAQNAANDQFNRQQTLSEKYFADQVARANKADAEKEKANEYFQNATSGVSGSQASAYSR